MSATVAGWASAYPLVDSSEPSSGLVAVKHGGRFSGYQFSRDWLLSLSPLLSVFADAVTRACAGRTTGAQVRSLGASVSLGL